MAGSTFRRTRLRAAHRHPGGRAGHLRARRPRIASRRRRSAGHLTLPVGEATCYLWPGHCPRAFVPNNGEPPAAGSSASRDWSRPPPYGLGLGSRRAVLAAEVSGGFEAERGRAASDYAETIAGIERRLAVATPRPGRRVARAAARYLRGTGAAAGRDRGEVRGPASHQAGPAACATGARTAGRGRRAARVAAGPDEFRRATAC